MGEWRDMCWEQREDGAQCLTQACTAGFWGDFEGQETLVSTMVLAEGCAVLTLVALMALWHDGTGSMCSLCWRSRIILICV